MSGRVISDDRGSSPVVGKALEAGIVVLYIALLLTVLYGGVVPEYRTAAGQEVGDRVLAEASQEIQGSIPADTTATAQTTVALPDQIHGSNYQIRADERDETAVLVLVHPDSGINGELPVVLPPDVIEFDGEWESTADAIVTVTQTDAGRIVELRRGDLE